MASFYQALAIRGADVIVLGRRCDLFAAVSSFVLPCSLIGVMSAFSLLLGGMGYLWVSGKRAFSYAEKVVERKGAASSHFEALFFSRRVKPIPCFDVENFLVLSGLNTRPDRESSDRNETPLCSFTWQNKETILSRRGESLYFAPQKEPGFFKISHTPTSYRIESIALENSAFVRTNCQGESWIGIFSLQPFKRSNSLSSEKYFSLFKEMEFWVADSFVSAYSEKPKDTFKIRHKSSNSIYSVSGGDYLVYCSGGWSPSPLEASHGLPLAKVLGVVEGKLCLEVWDETGFYKEKASISLACHEPYSFTKIENVFCKLKNQGNHSLSSVIGKKRVILKEGDWWIKTLGGFRLLRKHQEIEDFIAFKLIGELFVIDEIDLLGGKKVLKGRLFDPTRMKVQNVSIPIEEDAKRSFGTASSSKEKRPSKKRSKNFSAPYPSSVFRGSKEKSSS